MSIYICYSLHFSEYLGYLCSPAILLTQKVLFLSYQCRSEMLSNSLTICNLLLSGCGGTVCCPHGARIQCVFSTLAQALLGQSHCAILCSDSPVSQFSLISQSLFSLIFSPPPGYSQHFHSPSGSLGLLVRCPSLSGYGTKGL